MQLSDLLKYNPIVIQCHNNPDADALASAFGLYTYFESMGKDTIIVYGGREEITKSNLKLMCSELKIPAVYVKNRPNILDMDNSLLITVDCQYGAKNLEYYEAKNVAVIDHHRIEIEPNEMSLILSNYGSCSTIIWQLLKKEGIDVNTIPDLAMALYYGLYMDTKELSEIINPLDRDASEQLNFSSAQLLLFKNSNISLQELETAGLALLRYSYNEDYSFAVCKANECDPNILGIISDFLIQVDAIRVCVVFCKLSGGFKFSVRSCVREVDASQLAQFIADQVGSGGGHYTKSGGFISESLYNNHFPTTHAEAYFNNRLITYFDMYDLIYPADYDMDISSCKLYTKKKRPIGFAKLTDIMPVGTEINIRTIEGDIDMVVSEDIYAMIGIKGEVYVNNAEKFARSYEVIDEHYSFEKCVITPEYKPTVRNTVTGEVVSLIEYAHTCVSVGTTQIYARPLERFVKVFTVWDKEKYYVGKPGDYIACRTDDYHDVYIIEKVIFGETYEETNQITEQNNE